MTLLGQLEHPVEKSIGARKKEEQLRALMREMGALLVAYSGGVDSAYLAYIANAELGEDALCVLGISPSVSANQREQSASIARDCGFRFQVIETDEFADPNYVANPSNRCYFCKTELFKQLRAVADAEGVTIIADGTNFDDISDHRPGRLAAEEKEVRSPLVEVRMTKEDIREMSRLHGLPTWDKPSSPCLSSRIAYGVPVTIERLTKVEKGEAILRDLGFREFRLRVHGDLARIEISPDEFDKVLDREAIHDLSLKIKELGFRYVTLDLNGYRSGAMNETLEASARATH